MIYKGLLKKKNSSKTVYLMSTKVNDLELKTRNQFKNNKKKKIHLTFEVAASNDL